MKISEVVEGIALRCNGMDADKCAALASDMRAAGLKDGPSLHAAFDNWRGRWMKRFAPTAAEFAAFAVRKDVPDFGPPYNTPERILWDRAWKDARGYNAGWQAGERERADELGYLAHWKTHKAHEPEQRKARRA